MIIFFNNHLINIVSFIFSHDKYYNKQNLIKNILLNLKLKLIYYRVLFHNDANFKNKYIRFQQ